MTRWTVEQYEAISSRDRNLLVSAGAGSGKTAVLVERIIQLLIQEKIDLDRMLVVTFTQAAAAEMRSRIGEALLEQMDKNSGDENHLRHQLYLLNNASISTLHSFCNEILRRYFHLIDLDPNFKVADENEARLMKDEVVESLLEQEYQADRPEFTALAESFGGSKNDQPLVEMILGLYNFIHSLPHPWTWLDQQVECFNQDYTRFLSGPWVKALLEQIQYRLAGIGGLLKTARELSGQDPQLDSYVQTLRNDEKLIDQLLTGLDQGAETFFTVLEGIQFSRLGRAGREADPFLKEHVQGLRKEAREQLKKIKAMAGTNSLVEWHRDLTRLYPIMKCLARLLCEFHQGYMAAKEDKNLLDFNDLEHQALRVLEHEEAAAELRVRYRFIFVDEYQDSNLVQESIIEAICRENNKFLVGDIKQSIYRFRLSDPTLFLKKYREYSRDKNGSDQCIDLNTNFRSHPAILDVVNSLFHSIMSPDLGEMDYDEKACLTAGKVVSPETAEAEKTPPVQMILVEQEADSEDDDRDPGEWEGMELEARVVAGQIKEQMGKLIYDRRLPGLRPVQYRDIVVLMRATRRWATVFWEAFLEAGIPAYADINTGYFEALEVQIFLDLLRLIDNKKQDLPLLAVMRSQLGGFELEEMVQIRADHQDGPFYQALENYTLVHQDDLSRKIEDFQQQLRNWQEYAKFLPVDELLWKIMVGTGYYYYVGAVPGGSQRQANLRLLLDRARQYQQSSLHGLFHFINYLEKIRQGSGDLGVAKSLGENEDLVRIMSIHKSKGLEFPIVIVAGLGKKFNLRDAGSSLLIHRSLGLGPRYVDPDLRYFHDTLARSVIKNQILLENLSEEMRILYVALTRAESRLILVGSVSHLERSLKKWIKPLDAFNLSRAGSYLDWIGPVLIRHRDGGELRRRLPHSDLIDTNSQDSSLWYIRVLNQREAADQIVKIQAETMENFGETGPGSDNELISLVKERLGWVYPQLNASRVPSKLSVSQLRKLKNREEGNLTIFDIPSLNTRPSFLSAPEKERAYSAAERGSITHFVLQHLDLKHVSQKEEIGRQLAEMVEEERLSPEDSKQVNVTRMFNFFQSPLGQRALRASRLYRELPFNLRQDAAAFRDGGSSCPEPLIVQGVIDLCFLEDGEMVLVDFKTDAVADADQLNMVIDAYRLQIELYRQALQKIMGCRVKESYLYLFALEKEVPVI